MAECLAGLATVRVPGAAQLLEQELGHHVARLGLEASQHAHFHIRGWLGLDVLGNVHLVVSRRFVRLSMPVIGGRVSLGCGVLVPL